MVQAKTNELETNTRRMSEMEREMTRIKTVHVDAARFVEFEETVRNLQRENRLITERKEQVRVVTKISSWLLLTAISWTVR